MHENASRIVFALEAAFVMLPMTYLFAVHVVPDRALADPMLAARVSIAVALIAAALLCGWYLALEFAVRGRAGLRSASRLWWIAPGIAAAAGLGGLPWAFLMGKNSLDVGVLFVLGLPLLIPLAHLCLERWPAKG